MCYNIILILNPKHSPAPSIGKKTNSIPAETRTDPKCLCHRQRCAPELDTKCPQMSHQLTSGSWTNFSFHHSSSSLHPRWLSLAVIVITSIPLMFSSYRLCLTLRGTPQGKQAWEMLTGQAQGGSSSGKSPGLSVCRHWGVRDQSTAPQCCSLPERISLVVPAAPGWGILCVQRKFLCCRWVYFSFSFSWFNRKQREDERPADFALQVDLRRVRFSRETKNTKLGGGKAKIILN